MRRMPRRCLNVTSPPFRPMLPSSSHQGLLARRIATPNLDIQLYVATTADASTYKSYSSSTSHSQLQPRTTSTPASTTHCDTNAAAYCTDNMFPLRWSLSPCNAEPAPSSTRHRILPARAGFTTRQRRSVDPAQDLLTPFQVLDS